MQKLNSILKRTLLARNSATKMAFSTKGDMNIGSSGNHVGQTSGPNATPGQGEGNGTKGAQGNQDRRTDVGHEGKQGGNQKAGQGGPIGNTGVKPGSDSGALGSM